MSSKSITEKSGGGSPTRRWAPPTEMSPSQVRSGEPMGPRVLGAFGLAAIVFGGIALALSASGRSVWIGTGWATTFCLFGLIGLLVHAVGESDLQIRRAFLAFGYLWLAVGVAVSLLPIGGGAVGDRFLPHGVAALSLGYLFTLAALRNETDPKMLEIGSYFLGGLGALFMLVGFIGSFATMTFLFTHGIVLILLGLPFICAFVMRRGIADDWGYYAALAFGAIGAIAALYALGRSVLPPLFASRGWIQPLPSFLMPHGVSLTLLGCVYLGVSAGLVSDNPLVVMTRRQLGSFFHSPVAYFLLLLFSLVAAFQFFHFVLNHLLEPLAIRGAPGAVALGVSSVPEPIVRFYIVDLVPVFAVIFAVPVITMNLLSEENRTGTLEMTLTAPQEELTLILSKFLAGLVMFLLTWVPLGIFLISLRVAGGKPFDYQPFLAWTIALIFTGSGFVAMGLFFSSLTKNQLTAAVLSFVCMLVFLGLFLIKRQAFRETDVMYAVFTRISFVDIWWESLRGKLGISDLVYHLSVTVFWLFLTVKVLESRKWR